MYTEICVENRDKLENYLLKELFGATIPEGGFFALVSGMVKEAEEKLDALGLCRQFRLGASYTVTGTREPWRDGEESRVECEITIYCGGKVWLLDEVTRYTHNKDYAIKYLNGGCKIHKTLRIEISEICD